MRINEYKQLIIKVLQKHHLLTLTEIHHYVNGGHFASIYRNVEGLCHERVLKKIVIDRNNVRYELASNTHGHFVCQDCEKIEALEVPTSLTKSHAQVSDVLVRGLCRDCG